MSRATASPSVQMAKVTQSLLLPTMLLPSQYCNGLSQLVSRRHHTKIVLPQLVIALCGQETGSNG